MRNWYEFEIGLFVEANTVQEALDKLEPLVKIANTIDPEGDAAVKFCGETPIGD